MATVNNNGSLTEGNLRVIVVPNPAAGNDFTITVPDNVTWTPVGIEFEFGALGGGANRVPAVVYLDGTFRMAFSPIEGSINPLSGTSVRGFPNHGEQITTPPAGVDIITMPYPYKLHQGQKIESETENLGGSDIIFDIHITVYESIRPLV